MMRYRRWPAYLMFSYLFEHRLPLLSMQKLLRKRRYTVGADLHVLWGCCVLICVLKIDYAPSCNGLAVTTLQ